MNKTTVTVKDVCDRLIVTETQVLMAIYSGALPNPNEYSEWESTHVEPFLINWQDRINRRNKNK
jgi:hypothetical protein